MSHRTRITLLASLLAWLAAITSTNAQPPTFAKPQITAKTTWLHPAAHPDTTNLLAIQITIPHPFHINPAPEHIQDPLLIPTTIEITRHHPALKPHPPHYPLPTNLDLGTPQEPRSQPGYEGTVTAFIPVDVQPDTPPGDYPLTLQLTYQACTDVICLPAETIDIDVPLTVITPDQPPPPPTDSALFDTYHNKPTATPAPLRFTFFTSQLDTDPTGWAGYALVLVMAMVGGLVLNLTPCVLPIIPIKAMSLRNAAGSRARCLALGFATAAGIVLFWLALGAAISLISGLTLAAQLFQYPAFSITTGLIIALMAVGMCGLFAVRLPQWAYRLTPSQQSIPGSIGVGVMTAVLSTPCTGPFMGTAATWGVTQAPATNLAVFAAIGAGMAAPYLLLAAFPALIARIPQYGPTGETVKRTMGLLMLAAAAYFIGVGVTTALAAPGQPPSTAYWWAPATLCVAAVGYAATRTFKITHKPIPRAAAATLAIAFSAATVLTAQRMTDTGPIDWTYYTPQHLAQAQRDRRVIVLDFTAEWCINCRVLEETVLSSPTIVDLLNHPNVAPIKVDLTADDPDARALLNEAGSIAIPLLAVYNPDGEQIFKSEAYTATQLAVVLRQTLDTPPPQTINTPGSAAPPPPAPPRRPARPNSSPPSPPASATPGAAATGRSPARTAGNPHPAAQAHEHPAPHHRHAPPPSPPTPQAPPRPPTTPSPC